MRYRYLRHRYTVVVTTGQPSPLGDVWRIGSTNVILGQPHWRPEADVYETAAAIVVIVELAGVAEEDMDVLLFEDALVVEGRRAVPTCEEDGLYHAVGIRQGPFRLEVPLRGAINPAAVEAQYERGLLRIRLPKTTGGDQDDR